MPAPDHVSLATPKTSGSQPADDLRRLLEENLRYTKQVYQVQQQETTAKAPALHQLLEENLKISRELLKTTKKISRWINYQRVWGVVKLVLILVPIVLGVIYLPPLIRPLLEPYQQLLNFNTGSQNNTVTNE